MADVNSPSFWEEMYARGRSPWDLGGPAPVFRRLLEGGALRPGRMIVPGAGRGHDARLFAKHGFQVTAVDFAAEAVQAMRASPELGAPLEVLQADLFDLPEPYAEDFDYVLEYTCFCAIHPGRRPEYADVVARLLRPGGRLIALLFPVGERPGGPPFAVSPDAYARLFKERGFELAHREVPPDSAPGRRGVEELLILRKANQLQVQVSARAG